MHKSIYIIIMILLCIAGALINYFINYLVWLNLWIPLYLDTIMTIAMTFIAGPLWGCLTGALTNIFGTLINSAVWGWEGHLFALCNIATALVIWFFIRMFGQEIDLYYKQKITAEVFLKSRRFGKTMDRIIVLTLVSFALCLVMSIMGGIIAGIIYILGISVEGLSPMMFSENLPLILDQILSRIPVNIADRLISVFAGWGIAYIAKRIFGPLISTN